MIILKLYRINNFILLALAEHGERDVSPVLYSRVAKKLKEILNDLKNRHPSKFNR
jgi:transposase-like protein